MGVEACRPIVEGRAFNGNDYLRVVAGVEVVVTTGQPNNCSNNGVAVQASVWGIGLVAAGCSCCEML